MSKAKRESTTRRRHGAPGAILPPGDPAEAAQILHHVLDGDVLGFGPSGQLFLLLEVPGWMVDRVAAWGADAEDLEDSGDAEPGEDDEPDDDNEPDDAPRSDAEIAIVAAARKRWQAKHGRPQSRWVGRGAAMLDPVTGKPGRWVMQPREARS